MDRRSFRFPPQYPPSPGHHDGYYNSHRRPPRFQDGRSPETRRLSNLAPFDSPASPHHSRYWNNSTSMPVQYMYAHGPMIYQHPGHIPYQAQYPGQAFYPTERQDNLQGHAIYFRNPFENYDHSHGYGNTVPYQQPRNIGVPYQGLQHGSDHRPLDSSIVSPRPYRPISRDDPPQDTELVRRRSSSTDEYNSDSEQSSERASETLVDQPSVSSSSTRCELCDQVGHLGYNCHLAQWDEQPADTPPPPPPPQVQDSDNDVVANEDEEKYQQLAGKLCHICWNIIPDSEHPPESHKTMMKHILHVLSQHPDNTEVVYNHMFGEEFQRKWLCLKAICDPEWKGARWLIDGSCRYCNNPSRADPVTLCYQMKPNRNCMALYREVGIVRA